MTSESALRVRGIVSGHLTAAAGFWREGDTFDTDVVLPVPVYLIEVGEHRILFDTGLHPEGGVERYGEMFTPMKFDLPAAPPDVKPTMVVLSHLHFDHVGGLFAYPDIPVVLQQKEWDAATHIENPEQSIYRPIDYPALESLTLVDGEHDLLGDGRIVLHPLPGHTPGSQGLILKLDDGSTAILIADACYFPENVDSEQHPPYTWDREKELESLAWVREQRDNGAVIIYGHDATAGTFTV